MCGGGVVFLLGGSRHSGGNNSPRHFDWPAGGGHQKGEIVPCNAWEHKRESFREDSFQEDSFREDPRRALGLEPSHHVKVARRREGFPKKISERYQIFFVPGKFALFS